MNAIAVAAAVTVDTAVAAAAVEIHGVVGTKPLGILAAVQNVLCGDIVQCNQLLIYQGVQGDSKSCGNRSGKYFSNQTGCAGKGSI